MYVFHKQLSDIILEKFEGKVQESVLVSSLRK